MIEHCPVPFLNLRYVEGISKRMFIEAFSPENNGFGIRNFGEGAGKSSSFFFFTDDMKFVIKTVKKAEKEILLDNFLCRYHDHLINNPGSLLTRFYGLFTIKIGLSNSFTFVIMNNLMCQNPEHITYIYDLKGSLHNRKTKKKEEQVIKPTTCLKDLDFLENEPPILLDDGVCTNILDNLYADSQFLREMNMIDYSLLLIEYSKNKGRSITTTSINAESEYS